MDELRKCRGNFVLFAESADGALTMVASFSGKEPSIEEIAAQGHEFLDKCASGIERAREDLA